MLQTPRPSAGSAAIASALSTLLAQLADDIVTQLMLLKPSIHRREMRFCLEMSFMCDSEHTCDLATYTLAQRSWVSSQFMRDDPYAEPMIWSRYDFQTAIW
jgi:hypothetical protein